MYNDGSISYNPDSLNDAINAAKKLTSAVNENLIQKSDSLFSSMPKDFKGSLSVNSIRSSISSLSTNLLGIESMLLDAKNRLDKTEEDFGEDIEDLDGNSSQEGFHDVLLNRGYHETEIAGVPGYLYVPEGCSSTKGLPLITYLSGGKGYGMMYTFDEVKDANGLAKLLSSGCSVDAVVWVPTGTDTGQWRKSPDKENTVNSIKTLINDYDLDENRNSIVGYSLGAHGAFQMATDNPNLFSTVVSFGGYSPNNQYDKLADSNTTYIIYAGKDDEDALNLATNTFNKLNANGADVIMYQAEGINHGDEEYMFTNNLFKDLINIERDTRYTNGGEIINVSYNDFINSSIYNGISNTNVDNINASYYKQLAKENNIDEEDLNFDIDSFDK